MGKDAVPSLQNLERPEDLKALLKQDAGDDCMSCRLIGKIHLHLHQPHPLPVWLIPCRPYQVRTTYV